MKALEDRILKEGKLFPGQIVKVNSFLNHQIDSDFMMLLGKEIAAQFADCGITKILTIEASGIAIALAAGYAMHVPMIFAKKHQTANVAPDVLKTVIHSFTHGTDYTVVMEKSFLSPSDKVLIVDDFLANGKAIEGLLDLISQAGAEAVGAAVAIEKGFQHGGDKLREKGLRIESLAVIDEMDENHIRFR